MVDHCRFEAVGIKQLFECYKFVEFPKHCGDLLKIEEIQKYII